MTWLFNIERYKLIPTGLAAAGLEGGEGEAPGELLARLEELPPDDVTRDDTFPAFHVCSVPPPGVSFHATESEIWCHSHVLPTSAGLPYF